MDKFSKFASGSLWEPVYVLIPKLGASGSLWEPLYVLIPKLGASGSLWEPLYVLIPKLGAFGSLWEPLGASGPKMVKITSCLVFQFVVAEWAAEMNKFSKFASGSLWEPFYVLIPKLGASGSLWEPLYVLIPKLGASGWPTPEFPSWEPLGASGSRFMY
jgi:hypothetical protein